MNDNYFTEDLIASLARDVVMERYYPLIDHKEELTAILKKAGAVRKDQVSDAVTEDIRSMLGETVSVLFARFIHIYDNYTFDGPSNSKETMKLTGVNERAVFKYKNIRRNREMI